jgi:lysophospholipase L1-like esterase
VFKKLLALAALVSISSVAHAQAVDKISQLPAASSPLSGGELIPCVQGGVTKSCLASEMTPSSAGIISALGYAPVNPASTPTFSNGFGIGPAPNLYGQQVNAQSAYNPEGDSITFGLYATAPQYNYPSQIAADAGMLLTNRGISGEQACDMTMNETTLENPGASNNPLYTILIGTNDANIKGTGAYEGVYNLCHQAALSWLSIPSTFKVLDSAATATGTWNADSPPWNNIPGGENSSTAGSTLTYSITTYGAPIYFWYYVSDGWTGTFIYSVDNGPAVTVANHTTPAIATNNGGTAGLAVARIPVTAGNHTLVVTASGGSVVAPVGVGTPSNLVERGAAKVYVGGVPRQQNDQNSAATAEYNTDVINNVALLQGDGLPVYFVNVRNYLNDTSDMSNQLHPDNSGYRHLADAFESVAQPSNSTPTWQNYTPASPPTPGGGSFTSVSYTNAQYMEANKTVWFQITVAIATVGTASGCLTVALPVASSSTNFTDPSILYSNPLAKGVGYINQSATTMTACSLTNGSPWTGNGSAVVISGFYQAAY